MAGGVLTHILPAFGAALAAAWLGCLVVRSLSARAGAFDTAPVAGQFKEAARRVPNTGGVGVFLGAAAGVAAVLIAGAGDNAAFALVLLAALAAVHALGLIDDRRPLGPRLKLGVMALPPLALALAVDARLLHLVDGYVGGAWLSVGLTLFWYLAVTNAMNFIDNMDGASAGVGAIAAAALVAAAAVAGQWAVAGLAAGLSGACVGFLFWNFPRARLFMGDGGSLVLGMALAALTVRITYTGAGPEGEPIGTAWWAVFTPLVVLAVPLYDMLSVTLIRVRQGRSPMLGDLQHLSHRLVKRGLSKTAAVLVLWGMTAATAISGVGLGRLEGWQAALAVVQIGGLLGVMALLEFGSSPEGARADSLQSAASREAARG